MDIKDLHYFWRVYEEGGINRAAKQLFISPQGLSKVIQKLEEELDAPLFARTQNGMIPTEYGTCLYKHSGTILRKYDEIEADIRRIRTQSRQFRIGFSCGVLNVFPFQKLEVLRERLGSIPIRWDEGEKEEIIQSIEKDEYDAGFVIGPVAEQDLWTRELYSKKPDVIVYEGHPFYDRKELSVKELREERLITLNEKFYSYHSFVQRCRDFDFIPQIVIKTMESQLIYRFCREGLGLGIDVDIHQEELNLKGIKRIPLCDAIPWKIFLVIRRDRLEEEELLQVTDVF